MEYRELLPILTIVGMIATVLSFLVYVFVPSGVFIGTFIIGMVLMVGGYTLSALSSRKIEKELASREEVAMDRGCIISLDGPYQPVGDDATIEVLE
ncbi:MAG: hypothetical protein E7Z70_05505 [Thermoplasmata archaeon]|nr:hypothetical protein [Thermoplasmata archaeon]